MFEGKEFEKELGQFGKATVDVTPDLKLKVGIEVEIDLVLEAKKLAQRTNTPIDDQAIAWIEGMVKIAAAA